LLIDAGYPGSGTARSPSGDPRNARDAQRIAAACRAAGVQRIDYLLVTHFHADHYGGVVELSQLMPIRNFVDHGGLVPGADDAAPGELDAFKAYAGVRAKGRHIEPKPGSRLRLKGIDATVVSTAGSTIATPLAGAGTPNPVCGPSAREPKDRLENPRSTGLHVRFGRFRFLDLGDLTGQPLFALACPNDRIGPLDVYLVPHHGGADASEPATFAAFRPRVVVINNGATKGGEVEMFETLRRVEGLEDVWQLHRSTAAGGANFAEERIANLDDGGAYWVKINASEDGSFRVTNARTGVTKSYASRTAPI
jgi:L-ascorbate metabolism protein UlaG (beta-lactamase superfamily)